MAETLLIVDDNPKFGQLLAENLEQAGFDARICDPPDYQGLSEQVPPRRSFEILLDFSLDLAWLGELEADRGLAERLRIWIVTGVPDADIGGLRSRFPNLSIQQRWFDKTDPAFPDELATAIRQERRKKGKSSSSPDQSPPALPPFPDPDPVWLRDFPEPIRVLDTKGKVIWTNVAWSANPYTPPVDTEDLKEVPAQPDEWRETVRWGPLPHTLSGQNTGWRVKDGYYRLRERRFAGKDAKPTVLQWLSPITQPVSKKLDEEVGSVLREITRTHFTRARFYTIHEVPGSEGIISLEQQIGGLAGNFMLPVHRPLKGRILDRLREYRHISRDQMRKLEYKHIVEAEQSPDNEWAAWNRIIGTEDMVDWIEIPVLDWDGEEMQVLGLLICDCQGLEPPVAKKGESRDVERGKIPDEAIEWLENYLCFAVESLQLLLRGEAKRRRVAAHEAVMEAWRPLLHATSLENLEHALLQKAVEITDADGGWFLTAVQGTEQGLEIRAAIGTQQEKVRPIIPPGAKGLATVDAWETRGMIVEPCFKKSPRFLDLCTKGVWKLLAQTPADGPSLQKWFEKEIGSLVAAPVKRGEKVIGAVSLHHRAEMHFDPEGLVRLDDLLQVVAPLMEAETQRQGRTLWLEEVIHRIGARVNAVAGHLEILDQLPSDQRDKSSRQATEQAKWLRHLLTKIRDQEHQWQIGGEFDLRWPKRFVRIKTALKERFSLPERSISINGQDAFNSTPKLKGDSDALDMVLEELLGNAYRHTDGDGSIEIGAEIAKSYWLLRIANSGRIPKGEEEEIFKPDRRGSNAGGEGLGLGLATAKNTVRFHSGNLVLQDGGGKTGRVVFRLEWPYAPQS